MHITGNDTGHGWMALTLITILVQICLHCLKCTKCGELILVRTETIVYIVLKFQFDDACFHGGEVTVVYIVLKFQFDDACFHGGEVS